MSAAGKALWYIETHADQPLALADIAAAAGLSPFHLSRLFQARTGTSVMRYLRGRRLTAAAQQLANGAGDILQVALGAGYTTHAAFTRAFSEQFGQTPERVREQGTDGLALVQAIRVDEALSACIEAPACSRHPRSRWPASACGIPATVAARFPDSGPSSTANGRRRHRSVSACAATVMTRVASITSRHYR